MGSTDIKDAHFKVSKARTQLVMDFPFFGVVVMRLPIQVTDEVPTAAVAGMQIMVNPEFAMSLNDAEMIFLLAHECMHVITCSAMRKGNRDHRKWNVATDYVINYLLKQDKVGIMPKQGLYDAGLVDFGKRTAEQVYDLLPDQDEQQEPLDDVTEGAMSPDEIAQMENEVRILVSQAAATAQMAGKLSKDMARLVQEVVRPKVRWQDVLQRFVVRAKTDTRTYARPSRRIRNPVFFTPSTSGETMPPLVVAVDCSGSVTDKMVAEFAAEVRAIHTDTQPSELMVVYFDSRVTHTDTFLPDDTVEIRPKGGGGTAFSPVFRHIDEADISPVCCVVLTDLCCSDFGPAPEYPVIWVSTYSGRAPWGEVIMVNDAEVAA